MDQEKAMTGHDAQHRSPGPNIIRAWFDTVVNPLLEALRVEWDCLERNDWTWNHWRGALESIRPIDRHLDYAVLANLRQFYRLNRDIYEVADNHDNLVSQLWNECATLQSLLEGSEELRALYVEATLPENLAAIKSDLNSLFGSSSSEQERLAILSEYIVNNRGDLPDYYTVAPLWNAWRDRLLALRRNATPSITVHFEQAINTATKLKNLVEQLIGLLEDRRETLSIDNDVPPVNLAA
jgi:hypothetical protein